MTDETKDKNLPATVGDNPFAEVAAKIGGGGRFLKFAKGEWKAGDDDVPLGTKYIAVMDGLRHSWVKFVDGKKLGEVSSGPDRPFELPERIDLGDNDPMAWPKDKTGERQDPWTEQWALPLVGENGEQLLYATSSRGGQSAIGQLCRVYGRKHRNGFPIIALGTGSYKHPQYGRVPVPELNVVMWDGGIMDVVDEQLTAGDGGTPRKAIEFVDLEPKGAVEKDLNDEIPDFTTFGKDEKK
jgi:hypothetical protein